MSTLRFDPSSYAKGGSGMDDAGQELGAKTQALLAEVSDLTVLGTNDTLGGLSQMIYGAFLQLFSETAGDLTGGYADLGGRLRATGQAYQQVEESNVHGASQMVPPE